VRARAAVALAALALAGCGADHEVTAADIELADEYRSIEVTAGGEPRPLVPGTEIRVTFDGDRLGATLGCNQLGGRFSLERTRLVIEDLSSTEIGCDPALHDQDRWFADFLATRPQLLTSGDELVINDGFTTIVLRDVEVADPDRPLLRTTWVLDGFVDGDAASSAPTADGADVRLTFELDGSITGGAPCGPLSGADLRYDLDGASLRIEGTGGGSACPDAPEAQRYATVLAPEMTWRVDADRLTLTDPDGQGATFRAAEG